MGLEVFKYLQPLGSAFVLDRDRKTFGVSAVDCAMAWMKVIFEITFHELFWTSSQAPRLLSCTHHPQITGWNLWPVSVLFQTCHIWTKRRSFPLTATRLTYLSLSASLNPKSPLRIWPLACLSSSVAAESGAGAPQSPKGLVFHTVLHR